MIHTSLFRLPACSQKSRSRSGDSWAWSFPVGLSLQLFLWLTMSITRRRSRRIAISTGMLKHSPLETTQWKWTLVRASTRNTRNRNKKNGSKSVTISASAARYATSIMRRTSARTTPIVTVAKVWCLNRECMASKPGSGTRLKHAWSACLTLAMRRRRTRLRSRSWLWPSTTKTWLSC